MEDKFRIFNIQKFSTEDGPGIRTNVFFKGCPLHCPWCSNPESQAYKIQMTWDKDKCINCRACEKIGMTFIEDRDNPFANKDGFLPKDMYFSSEKKAKEAISLCPSVALSYEGYDMEIDDIMEKVMDDYAFYEESGGGLTISGGEVLSQVS